ncbi:PREDICTED: F-box protein At3g44326-like [Camelina sativa]|uniref:F-box protein At3g44326-like n=1 Tax=Camelina sativa TaxID=90675 RepID=A0ABM0YM43_CAMSA|nr:PREDICTED: F-box protein At3g44326-like [Camelina sativa]
MLSSSSMVEQPSRIKSSGINAVSSDVLRSNILTRVDGASLAALSCTCIDLHSFSSEESLWKQQCSLTWPSTLDARIQSIISTFPAGHRTFFSDSFPFLEHNGVMINLPPTVECTTELVSAVDIFYKGEVIFSKVHVTETVSGWFLCSPMRVDLVEPKELISTRVSLAEQWEGDTWKSDLEKNLSLSWILIDPTRKRAADVSTRRPVSVERHWLTGEVHVKFSTVFVVGEKKKKSEEVEFTVTVVVAAFSRRGEEKAEVQIREVSLVAEDMEGKNLGGKNSLVILASAMGMERRRFRVGGEEEGKEKYKEFMERKTGKADMKWRREKETAMETAACWIAVLLLGFLLCFYLFIHKNIMAIMNKLMK